MYFKGMISFFIFALIIMIPKTGISSDRIYEILTTRGSVATVYANVLRYSCATLAQDDVTAANVKYFNSDGSVTIVNPQVLYAGSLHRIVSQYGGVEKSSPEGICTLFGLEIAPIVKSLDISTQKNEIIVEISSNGKIYGEYDLAQPHSEVVKAVKEITCRARIKPIQVSLDTSDSRDSNSVAH